MLKYKDGIIICVDLGFNGYCLFCGRYCECENRLRRILNEQKYEEEKNKRTRETVF